MSTSIITGDWTLTDASRPDPTATREGWLLRASDLIAPLIAEQGHPELPPFRVSVGWPRGSRGGSSHAIGQCWYEHSSADKTREVFISPELGDPARVLDVLAHELVHVALPAGAKHGRDFKRVAEGIGLTGKMTATVAGEAFTRFATEVALPQLGAYPHASLARTGAGGPGKQSTRMLKLQCDSCGMIVRTTMKWVEGIGLPTCACDGAFELAT